jgi:hypothetical protein
MGAMQVLQQSLERVDIVRQSRRQNELGENDVGCKNRWLQG